MKLYEWKACVLVTNEHGASYGLWTYVQAEDADAAAENAELTSGGEIVTLVCVDPAWNARTLSERLAA